MHKSIKKIEFTPAIQHSEIIPFPNGMGYTPCSLEYKTKYLQMQNIHDPSEGNLDDLSPEEYQAYSLLDHQITNLQLSGHVGKAVRY